MKEPFEIFYDGVRHNKELNEMWDETNRINKKNSLKATITTIIIIGIAIFFFARYWGIKSLHDLAENKDFFVGIVSYMAANNPIQLIFLGMIALFLLLFMYVVIHMAVYYVPYSKNYGKFNNLYKENIINRLFENFFREVDYVPLKGMPKEIYKEGFPEAYDIYRSDDYVEATLSNESNEYRIKMANVKTYEEVREEVEDSNGNKHVEYREVLIFGGLFVKVNTNNSIKNKIRISSGGYIQYVDLEPLQMDSKEFEKHFDVRTSDKIVGMEILTHDVMDILIGFKEKYDKEFEIYVKDDSIYIRVHVGETFESKINGKEAVDEKILREYFDIVEFVDSLTICMVKAIEETEI